MARKHNSKKDSKAKARARKEATAAEGSGTQDWIEQRAAEEQAKMDNNAVKDVTYDPVFTPAAKDPEAVAAKSKEVPTDPDWKDKMQARGKGDVPPTPDASIEDDRTAAPRARSKNVQAARSGITPSRGQVNAPSVATPATKAAVKAASKGARKSAKGTRASGKTARKGNKAGTVKTGV